MTRWIDAINPLKEGDNGERIYESWDCPQVVCTIPYVAKENDELTLQVNDRMDILTKAVDGKTYSFICVFPFLCIADFDVHNLTDGCRGWACQRYSPYSCKTDFICMHRY